MGVRLSAVVGLSLALATVALAGDPPASSEPQFLSKTRQLTFEGKRSGEAYFSHDGHRLIFQSERDPENPFYQIFTLDLDTGETKRVSPGIGKTTCAFFSPDDRFALFASTHDDPAARKKMKEELDFRASGKTRRYSWDYDPTYEIFETDLKTNESTNLTNITGYDAEGDYSLAGKKIVFTSNREAYGPRVTDADRKRLETDPSYFCDIYSMNRDGTDPQRLTTSPGYDGGPFFSPSGRQIVWRRFNEEGTLAEVWLMDSDGSNQRQLTHLGAMSWAPYFHPSGDYIIFTTNKHGFDNFELYMVDAAGKHEPVRVTNTDGFDGLPVFSPEGNRLAWTSSRTDDKTSQIFMANWDDAAARKALDLPPRAVDTAAAAPAAPAATAPPAALPVARNPEFTIEELKDSIGYLASDELGGRLVASPGEKLAAEFLAGRLRAAGLKPYGKAPDYKLPFTFTSGVDIEGEAKVSVTSGGKSDDLALNTGFIPFAFSESTETEAPVIFAGYGLVTPGESKGAAYNSYDGLDVKGKIVLVLRFVPENADTERRQQLMRYSALRYKALLARERGAAGLLLVTGPLSPKPGELIPLGFDTTVSSSGIPCASISIEGANRLLAGSGKTIEDLQKSLDDGKSAKVDVDLKDAKARLSIHLKKRQQEGTNVVGVVEAATPTSETLIICGHYDHLGIGVSSNSLARAGEEKLVHHGADDNASGSAAVLELAEAWAARAAKGDRPKRNLAFAFWSGEEEGLLGSAGFVDQLVKDTGSHHGVVNPPLSACLNFDMVGRLVDDKLTMQGLGSAAEWKGIIERRNVPAGFALTLQDDAYLPTDTTSFYPKGVPVLQFFTNVHDDYHRPTDTADKINYDGELRILRFADAIIRDVANADKPLTYKEAKSVKSPFSGGRDSMRVYLGSIPDYAAGDIKGVKLSGVRGGSPAEKAGLKGGDVVVELAGQKITNIYDYTYALDALKIGKETTVKVQREGKEVELKVTPGTRP